MLDDSRVMPGREPRRAGALREREQLAEAERAVAARAGVRRLAARIAANERLDDGAPELLAEVERHVREAEAVARAARRADRVGRAAGSLAVRRCGIDPEPKRDTDRVRASRARARRRCRRRRSSQPRCATRDGAARKTGPIAAASASTASSSPPTAAASSSVRPRRSSSSPSASASTITSPSTRSRAAGPLAAERRVAEGLDHERTRARWAVE